jgi:hypothetical protein
MWSFANEAVKVAPSFKRKVDPAFGSSVATRFLCRESHHE